jgi:4-amino-4-deoxy-L-arabinose transferase-like glycosyltransferase
MAIVWMIAMGTVVVHAATGWRYGFNRDELMALEDARYLAWGYVQYPPMTAFFGRIALTLFGTSLVGFRFFASLAQALALVLTGLLAKELGGGKWAQVVAALAGVPFCLGGGALMQYISFDYVCWVGVAYCMVRVLSGSRNQSSKTENAEDGVRWWIGVGAGIGMGMMAKYTMGFLAVGVVAGVLLTTARRYLRSGWLWGGVLLAVGICMPNLWWQWQRHFVSFEFLRFIHVRDVREGLTDWFLLGQLELMLLAFPLALAGNYFYLSAEEGRPYRVLGWMYGVPLVLFLVMRGRDYYLAPGYPMLYAAGAVWLEKKIASAGAMKPRGTEGESRNAIMGNRWGRTVRRAVWVALTLDIVVAGAVALPIAPVKSRWWNFAAQVDTVLPEEIGWPEYVETVARVQDRLPAEERARMGILAGNYGEIGALNLYGEKYGLPRAISGVNSSWERGYGEPPPVTVIVVGYSREFLEKHFASCEVAAHVWNRYGVANEETIEDPDVFVCRGLKESWGEFWKAARLFA